MADGIPVGLKLIIKNSNFNPEVFFKNLTASGEHNIDQIISGLESLVEQTSSQMKQTVYRHYGLFIEAAKEVSMLDGEMHQMHSLLKDQKRILQKLSETHLFDEDAVDHSVLSTSVNGATINGIVPTEVVVADNSREALAYLLERVDGSSVVAEVPGRRLIFHGDVRELDPENGAERQRLHIFLLNDSVVFAERRRRKSHTSLQSSDVGPLRFRLQSRHELDSVSVVQSDFSKINSAGQSFSKVFRSDFEVSECSFMLKIFPEVRLFEPENDEHGKERWLNAIETAKRQKMAADSRKHHTTTCKLEADDLNPFMSTEDVAVHSDPLCNPPLLDAPDDLDVLLAERRFEEAVQRLEACHTALDGGNMPTVTPAMRELRDRLEQRKVALINLLVSELARPAAVCMRAGPRAARHAVKQLVRLGKTQQAVQVFLSHRSAIGAHTLELLRREESQLLFAHKLIVTFYRGLVETWRGFSVAGLATLPGCRAALVNWTRVEMGFLGDRLLDFLPVEQTSFSIFAAAMQVARVQAEIVQKNETPGADLAFFLHVRLATDWENAIQSQTACLTAAADKRAAEERWCRAQRSNAKEMEAFVVELEAVGVPNLRRYVERRSSSRAALKVVQEEHSFICYVGLATSTLQMTKALLELTDALSKLYTRELHFVISDSLSAVLRSEWHHFQRCLTTPQLMNKEELSSLEIQREFILKNLTYVIDEVLPMIESKMSNASGLNAAVHFDSFVAVCKMMLELRQSARVQLV